MPSCRPSFCWMLGAADRWSALGLGFSMIHSGLRPRQLDFSAVILSA